MKAVNDNMGTPIAKGLNVLLVIAMVFMAIAFILMLVFGFILTSDNAISAEILTKLAETQNEDVSRNVFIACFGGAIIAAIWFYVLRLLRKIVGTLLSGDPFIPENISRLRKIWVFIALSEIIRIIFVNIASTGEMFIDVRAGTIFLVFVIAALSEVFRHGAELRRDAELTI